MTPASTLSFRDPIHGFIRADPLEQALISSRPMQRLRFIHQLGFTYLVFPGAEHSRFSHVLGAMALAGRVYDHLAARSDGLLPAQESSRERRLVRAAALVHDVGHAPFSHSAEDLFEGGIDHEEMTRRLLFLPEIEEIFATHGDGLEPGDVVALLKGKGQQGVDRILSQIISGELDVDKMDYLQRDSLYCGVRYGNFDLERLLDTIRPLQDPHTGSWGIGVAEGGVHALEALVLARYYMFTQVYFNVTGKVLELHLNEWLRESQRLWPADPESFLLEDDVSVLSEMRQSTSVHARAITHRERFTVAFESKEHLSQNEKARFEAILPSLEDRFGSSRLLISNSEKDPHRLGKSGVLVRQADGSLEFMEEASHFIRHLTRIDRYRIYAPREIRESVAAAIHEHG
ncbi:MAG: HD domain-containing protein [Deltaproteobacteria bacterium]|nr:HD domain-containing protein [Deltaproteobacteria bacterium]